MNKSLEWELNVLGNKVFEWSVLIPRAKVTWSRKHVRKLKKRREKSWDEYSGKGTADDRDQVVTEEEEPMMR